MIKLLSIITLTLSTFFAQANTITHFSWGRVEVEFEGKKYSYKDCKISPKGPQVWDWNEFGTRHVPGIQIKDLNSIIDDCDIIILSKGVDEVLQTKAETIDYIEFTKDKGLYILQSEKAVKQYNELVAQGKKVGILLHSTC